MATELSPLAYDFVHALDHIQSMLGDQTFTWKGTEVNCVPSSLRAGQGIEIGGFMREITLTLIVQRNNFLSADSTLVTVDSELYTSDSDMPHPVAGRTLVFRGKTYRILAAREAAPRSHYELDLGDHNR